MRGGGGGGVGLGIAPKGKFLKTRCSDEFWCVLGSQLNTTTLCAIYSLVAVTLNMTSCFSWGGGFSSGGVGYFSGGGILGHSPRMKHFFIFLLILLFEGHEPAITEWEFLPHIGPRPPKGFVGLKNAGATCYMNSVLQQLYMISPIRDKVLEMDMAAQDLVRQNKEEEQKEHERLTNKASKNDV